MLEETLLVCGSSCQGRRAGPHELSSQICEDSVVTHLNKGTIREKASMSFHPGGYRHTKGRDEVTRE